MLGYDDGVFANTDGNIERKRRLGLILTDKTGRVFADVYAAVDFWLGLVYCMYSSMYCTSPDRAFRPRTVILRLVKAFQIPGA